MNIFSDHKERIITGLALLGVVLVVGFINNFYLMWLVFGAIYLVAFKEAMALYDVQNDKAFVYAVGLWLVALIYPSGDDLFILAGVIYASAIAYDRSLEWKNFLPFIYPTAGMLFMFTMYQEYNILALMWLLVVVALTDIGAYIVGKSIGKTKFSETSPNKTLEGVVGGVLLATFGGMFMGLSIVDFSVSLAISLFVSLASVFGDLYESSLKRKADVKDSGVIFPGHGGMLDRLDGYLFGGIVMLVLLRGLV